MSCELTIAMITAFETNHLDRIFQRAYFLMNRVSLSGVSDRL
jgi:hypothetical protein